MCKSGGTASVCRRPPFLTGLGGGLVFEGRPVCRINDGNGVQTGGEVSEEKRRWM